MHLVVMAREPVAGRVKSRLARQIGIVEATRFYRHASQTVLLRLSRTKRWQTWLAVDPGLSATRRWWPRNIPLKAQGKGDLAQRMQRIMDWPVHGPIVIVGTDIPGICSHHIAAAFKALGNHDAVFGPATDGGYWLVGLRRCPRVPKPFAGVRWSSPFALSDTRNNLSLQRTAEIAVQQDVDDGEDLRRVARWTGRVVPPPSPNTH